MEKALIRFCTFMFLVGAGSLATHWVVERFVKPVVAATETATPPDASAWKLQVLVKDEQGDVLDVLYKLDNTGLPTVWPTQAECETYMKSAEFQNAMPRLSQYLADHYPKGNGSVFHCVPAEHPKASI